MSEATRSAGVDLILAPVRGLPDAAAVRATANALADLDDGAKILMFCRSGMRSTAAWAMVMRAAGADRESLVEAAAGAGYDLGGLPL